MQFAKCFTELPESESESHLNCILHAIIRTMQHPLLNNLQKHARFQIRIWMLIFCFLSAGFTSPLMAASASSSLRVSILTCGVGEDLYACYGHSAIRIIDSSSGNDIVYNYGTFNFGDPDFYTKFIRGKLPYYLNPESFSSFMDIYQQEGRGVDEQLLDLDSADALSLQHFLLNNLKEENKYYHYDFLLDNCSTRIRDIFPKLFGKRFSFGYAVSNDSCSFRQLLDQYEKNKHWERVGINVFCLSVMWLKQVLIFQAMLFMPYFLFYFSVQ